MEEAAHDWVKIAGSVVVQSQVVIVLTALEESGVTDRGLLEGLAQGVGEGWSAVNVVGDTLYQIAATIGDNGGGANIVGMNIVRRRGVSVVDVQL